MLRLRDSEHLVFYSPPAYLPSLLFAFRCSLIVSSSISSVTDDELACAIHFCQDDLSDDDRMLQIARGCVGHVV